MRNLKSKLALTATTALASQAQGAIIISPTVGSGIKPPESEGTNNWDVDGDGTNDFSLIFAMVPSTAVAEFAGNNAGQGRFIKPTVLDYTVLMKLSSGFVVQDALSGGKAWPTGTFQTARVSTSGGLNSNVTQGGWTLNSPGYFGFRFTSGSNTHYGWASMIITGTPVGQGCEITQAYYESTPGAAIAVGAVPEPSSLALLALGALAGAGFAARRRKMPSPE